MGEKIKKRRLIYEVTPENDMKYRGPLSPRHFKIIGWAMLILGQIGKIVQIYARITSKTGPSWEIVSMIFGFIGSLALPMFIIANFAAILTDKGNYKKQFIKYGALSLLIAALFFYLYEHILLGAFTMLSARKEAQDLLAAIFPPLAQSGFFAFNIFIDLLLCTAALFFLEYRPKRVFVGKKLILFRLLVLLPIAYEIGSITAKMIASSDALSIPSLLFPFLTTKPPMTFVLFIAFTVFLKRRERRFLKNGKTQEDYEAFLKTNTNSFQFGRHSAILLVIAAVIDFIACIAVTLILCPDNADEAAILAAIGRALEMGFGESIMLLFIAPLMLLFCYNRTYKNTLIDLAVPAGGVVGMVFVYIEGVAQIIRNVIELGLSSGG